MHARHPQQQQQHIPRAKRPAALIAGTAIAPAKRQRFDHGHHWKATTSQLIANPEDNAIRSTSSVPTQIQQKPSQQIQQAKQIRPLISNEQVGGSKKDDEPLATEVSKSQQSVSTELDGQIQKELELLANIGNSREVNAFFKPLLTNSIGTTEMEHILRMTQSEALQALQSFALPPQNYSKLVAVVASKGYQIDRDTANKLMPFLRTYEANGATGIEKFYAQFLTFDHEYKPKSVQPRTLPPYLESLSKHPDVTTTKGNELIHDLSDDSAICKLSISKNDDEEMAIITDEGEVEMDPDELLKKICTSNSQDQSLSIQKYNLHRPDILDQTASNFEEQVKMLFSSHSSSAKNLVMDIAHHSSSVIISKVKEQILGQFDSSLSPPSVIDFITSVYTSFERISIGIKPLQCFTLALYIVEEASQNNSTTALEQTVKFRMEKFVALITQIVNSDSDASFPQQLHRIFQLQRQRFPNMTTDPCVLRKKQAFELITDQLFHHFPTIPKEVPFLGMIDSSRAEIAQADRILANTLSECFELVKHKCSTSGDSDKKLFDMTPIVKKLEKLVKFSKNNQSLIARQMPLLATKMQDLAESLTGREIRGTLAVPLLLYLLDIVSSTMTPPCAQRDDSRLVILQMQSILPTLNAILQILQIRKNRLIPFLVEKTLQAVILFVKDNPVLSREFLAENMAIMKDMLERNQHVLSIVDRDILKGELCKVDTLNK